MDNEIGTLARAGAATFLGFAAAKGWLPAGDYGELAAAFSGLAVAVWGVVARRNSAAIAAK